MSKSSYLEEHLAGDQHFQWKETLIPKQRSPLGQPQTSVWVIASLLDLCQSRARGTVASQLCHALFVRLSALSMAKLTLDFSASVQLMTWCISVPPVTGSTLIITGEVLGAGIWSIVSKQTAYKGSAIDKMDPGVGFGKPKGMLQHRIYDKDRSRHTELLGFGVSTRRISTYRLGYG